MILTQHGRDYIEAIDEEEDGWTERDGNALYGLIAAVGIFFLFVGIAAGVVVSVRNASVRAEAQSITGERE